MMKFIYIIALIGCLGITNLHAQKLPGNQNDRYYEGEIKEGDKISASIGGYLKSMNNENSLNFDVGAEIDIYLTDRFNFGIHVFYMFDQGFDFDPFQTGGSSATLRLDYYGLNLGYKIFQINSIVVNPGLNFGIARLSYNTSRGTPVIEDPSGDWAVYVEPKFELNYSFSKTFAVGSTVAYRTFSGVDYSGIDNGSLSGFSVSLGVVFYSY